MATRIIRCDNCQHPIVVRTRDDGSPVLPSDGFECTECGKESYSFLDEEREAAD